MSVDKLHLSEHFSMANFKLSLRIVECRGFISALLCAKHFDAYTFKEGMYENTF